MFYHNTRSKKTLALQAQTPKKHQESQIPVDTDNSNVSAPSLQAGATANADSINRSQASHSFDPHTDSTLVALAALNCESKHNRVFKMDTIKLLLSNFLDHIKEPQTKPSTYLDGLLSQWLGMWRRDRSHALLIYIFGDGGHQYKGRKLDINNMDTSDQNKMSILKQQSSEQGVALLLAKMTSAVERSPDNVLEVRPTVQLIEIHDLHGGLLVNKPVTTKSESIVQKDYLKDRCFRFVEYQKAYPILHQGSPAPQIDTLMKFEDWVLLIMPEGHRFKFLIDKAEPPALHDWLIKESADLTKEVSIKADATRRWGLALACKTQLNHIRRFIAHEWKRGDSEGWFLQAKFLRVIVRVSLKLRDSDLFGSAITMDPMLISVAAWKEVGSTMEIRQSLLPYRKWLNLAISRIAFLQDRYIILSNIREGAETQRDQASLIAVENWFQYQTHHTLSSIRRVDENDGEILATIVKKYPLSIAVNKILTFAQKHSSNYKFTIEFAFSLCDAIVEKTIETGRAKYILTGFLSSAVPGLCLRGPENWSLQPWCPFSASPSALEKSTIHADRMVRLLRCCRVVGFYTEEHLLLRHYYLDADLADADTLQNVFLPYLKGLLNMMHTHCIPLTEESYQWQFQQVLSNFIVRYIGVEPCANFKYAPLGCAGATNLYACFICFALDAFLVDPRLETTDVFGGIDTPEHLTTQLQGTDHLQMTVTSHSAEHMTSTVRITKPKAKAEVPGPEHDLWRERAIKANDMIQDICGDETWKKVLGDKYHELMGLKAVMRS